VGRMARSLDELIKYLLDEIALCGEQGMWLFSLAQNWLSIGAVCQYSLIPSVRPFDPCCARLKRRLAQDTIIALMRIAGATVKPHRKCRMFESQL